MKLSILQLAQALSVKPFSVSHDSPRLISLGISSLNVFAQKDALFGDCKQVNHSVSLKCPGYLNECNFTELANVKY